MTKKYKIEKLNLSDRPYYVITPKRDALEKVVLFIHGGAFVMEISSFHWKVISKIVDKTSATVYVPIYPLAPHNNYKPTIDMMENVYREILTSHQTATVSIMGDSAGAQIALSFCQYIKTISLPQPNNIILVSPPTEMNPPANILAKMEEIEPHDPMLSVELIHSVAQFWTKGTSAEDYLVSPIYGNFSGLAPLYIFSGTYEIFNAQVQDLIHAATKAGVSVAYFEGKEMMHTWVLLPFSKESRHGLNQILEIIGTK